MERPFQALERLLVLSFAVLVSSASGLPAQNASSSPEAAPPQGSTYMPILIGEDFDTLMARSVAARPALEERQRSLLGSRYDLRDDSSDVMMSGGRQAVQQGVRVRLPDAVTWQELSAMTPEEIREQDLFPMGFRPLPHVDHVTGGQVFRPEQIDAIREAEGRSLTRFDMEFDLPTHMLPEYPPPLFLTTRPDLGDVSRGEAITLVNYYQLMNGIITSVQMEGLRLLLTPIPQQQFNSTDDRRTERPSQGVSCFDCHTNGHTNATFHLNPDTRPQAARFRLDTTSLRGEYNQQIHGSMRSLRSIEDFTEFEQRTAYFDGDIVTAAWKGAFLPDRTSQVSLMAQMQNIIDFPPAPKLDVFGHLIPSAATEQELRGEALFFGPARCAECHPAPHYLDNRMHSLHLERFYAPETISDQYNMAEGPIKTFTLRGLRDSPPYHHDGRLMTIEDTVEFYNLVLGLRLTDENKADLTAFLRVL